jgi:hypothetical protein
LPDRSLRQPAIAARPRQPTVRHIVPRIENVWPHGRKLWFVTEKEGMVSPLYAMAGVAIEGNIFHGLSAPFPCRRTEEGFAFMKTL